MVRVAIRIFCDDIGSQTIEAHKYIYLLVVGSRDTFYLIAQLLHLRLNEMINTIDRSLGEEL